MGLSLDLVNSGGCVTFSAEMMDYCVVYFMDTAIGLAAQIRANE